jgi:CheY-like chemotaxis protein
LGTKKRLEILIVEDDLIVSRMHKFNLSGFIDQDPQICFNGQEALQHLDEVAENREKILVLLDLNMPGMNGWEFLENCRSKPYAEKLHVVVVTSSSFTDDKQRSGNFDQVKAYYSKPLKREHISEIIQKPEILELIPG